MQADGKIVAGGYASPDFLLIRLNTNGDLDTSFGNNGKVSTLIDSISVVEDITIQKDGKIIAAGFTSIEFKSKFALARYTANGQLDKNFGANGIVTTEFETNPFAEDVVKSVQLLKDGRILAVGYSIGLAMARYMPDGSMDTTFADKGRFTANNALPAATDVVLLNDNKFVVCGSADVMVFNKGYNLAMFHENGRLDSSFGNDGQLLLDIEGGNDQPRSMVLLSNNELVVAGSSKPERVSTTVPASFTLVKYVFDAVNSVTDHQEPIEPWIIFPNPSSTYFSLVSKQNFSNATHIELLNSSGKVVLEQAIEGSEIKIDVQQLPQGIYLYKIHSKNQILQSGKVVKQ